MKIKPSCPVMLILGLATIFILGCQIASQATPVPTSVADQVSTPASAPTQAATPALAASKLDISSAVLRLDDLPAGFEELTLEELGTSLEDFSSEGFQPESAFVFLNN